MRFEFTDQQRKAYDDIAKAIKRAEKLGLKLYGKGEKLVAYTTPANNYINEVPFHKAMDGPGQQIHCISEHLLVDSGADDFPVYRTLEDEQKYAPEWQLDKRKEWQ